MSINQAYDLLVDPVTNIAPNTVPVQKVTRVIPAVGNIQDIIMELVNLTVDNITLLNLKVNNTIVQQVTGPSLDLMNQEEGLPPSDALAGNDILVLSQRRNRALGGGIQSIVTNNGQISLVTGSPKDLETVTGLNCDSKDGFGNQLNTVVLEFYLANTGAGPSSISITGNAYDPFPGGPGLLKFVDYKTFNSTIGMNVLDKATAYNIGDGMRINLDKIYYIPDDPTMLMDNWIHYLGSKPIKQRTEQVNKFINLMSALNTNPTGLFVMNTRELLYGDETLFIGDTTSQFRTQVDVSVAGGNINVFQVSQGTLFPTLR